jgi:hypothetical protein
MARRGAQALLVFNAVPFITARQRIAELAVAHRLPTVVQGRTFAEAGGLISYYRRGDVAARYRLRGQDPPRCEAGGPSRGTSHEARACDQSENREGARAHDPAVCARAGGPDYRVGHARPTRPTARGGARPRRAPSPVLRPLPLGSPHVARLVGRHRALRRWHGAPGLRPPVDAVRRARLAGDLLPVGIAHSIVRETAWEPTPWRAVQRAAWETVKGTVARQ